MSSNTIDFGIDLGTTNSAVAKFIKGKVKVFKNYRQKEITPSVVQIDEKGEIIVGERAYENLVYDDENTAGGFKRLMGTQQVKRFVRSKRTMGPEELSSEVLKALKQTVTRSLPDQLVNASVIAVPCNFETIQTEATNRAAKLAGIEFAPLLQEPISAAFAAGFLEKLPEGYLAVYDLGGGTFDIALLSVREGILSIVTSAGDNWLGGTEFDWKIVEEIVFPTLKREYNLPDLSRSLKKYKSIIAVSKASAEDAKIELTERENAEIIIHSAKESLKDKDGRIIDMRIPITRKQYENLIEDYMEKTIYFFKKVLKEQKLDSSDIEQMILVGGPTFTPYIRKRLKEEFNIYTDYDIDPMTIVAQGATLFAHTQFIPESLYKKSPDKIFINLAYNSTTTSTEAPIGGKVELENRDLNVIIERTDGGWQSGMLEIKSGAFFTKVNLIQGKENMFRIKVIDKKGNPISAEPSEFSIIQGISVDNPPLPHSIGVKLEDGTFDPHFERGAPLPAKSTKKYFSTKSVLPGSSEEFLIQFYEGEFENANHNRHLDELKISGNDVDRKIEVGDSIDVTMYVNESRLITAKVYVEKLDKTISGVLKKKPSPKPDLNLLKGELENIKNKRVKIDQEKEQIQDNHIVQELDSINLDSIIVETERDIAAANGGDPGAVEKASRRLKDLGGYINQQEKLIAFPKTVAEFNELLKNCQGLINIYGTEEEKRQFDILKKEAEESINEKNIKKLEENYELLSMLFWTISFRIDDFWIMQFNSIYDQSENITFLNGQRAKELFSEGTLAIQRKDIESLKSIVMELCELMSKEDKSRAGVPPGLESHIRK
ncbi:MAG: Hsp70 family protein [Candidatus Helarchaeota archaeon]|nr:Hsp70 family protein [Candidatus Helarchaeota archaeon]